MDITQAVRNSFGFPFPVAKSYDLYASHYDLFFLFCFRIILLLLFCFFSAVRSRASLLKPMCDESRIYALHSVELVLCPCFICMCVCSMYVYLSLSFPYEAHPCYFVSLFFTARIKSLRLTPYRIPAIHFYQSNYKSN